MIRSTQRKMLRVIVQIKRKYKKTQTSKTENDGEDAKANHRSSDDETAEGTQIATKTAFIKDADEDTDTAEIEEEDWLEHMNRSTALAFKG